MCLKTHQDRCPGAAKLFIGYQIVVKLQNFCDASAMKK
jgi:hypothetical protein